MGDDYCDIRFYRATAMLSAVYAVVVCLCVCVRVRVRVRVRTISITLIFRRRDGG